MTILKDPIRPFVPPTERELLDPGRGVEPAVEPPSEPVEDGRAAPRRLDPIGATSFELSSRGGYARTVTGTLAYLDEEAETYMVLGHDGRLQRVPLRDITSTRTAPTDEDDRARAGRDTEGLGTGDVV